MKRVLKSVLGGAVVALVLSGVGVGAVAEIEQREGRAMPRGPGPKKQPRKQAQIRLQAAQAKREKRLARNRALIARGGYSR